MSPMIYDFVCLVKLQVVISGNNRVQSLNNDSGSLREEMLSRHLEQRLVVKA
jgi:hypothetical protein